MGLNMICKQCGKEMYLAFTNEWVCRDCGLKYDFNGKFLSKDVKQKED
jgi:DNA-directed RNA polymerase subunit M/transcription elongation factor TFIIS